MLVTLLWGLSLAGTSLAEQPDLAGVLQAVRSEVRSSDAMLYMREVYSRDNRFTFPQFEKTARYLHDTLAEHGLDRVEIVHPPADGVTQYGYWTMPLAWDVGEARLEVLEPEPPEQFRVLANFRDVPASLAMWSGPTPAEGVVAEVVDIWDWDEERIKNLDLRGKVVLSSRNPDRIKWLLAKQGAVGAINAFTENPDLRDARQWVNAWGDSGWGYKKGDALLFGFSITPRQAEWLRVQMGSGKTVRVRAEVNSRYYEGSYPYVTAVVPGNPGAEEVLMLGHTSETGAQDNATGVAAMVEAAAVLNRLIRAGRLPRPRRSIRLLAMGELYGSMHYITENSERIRNTVAAICLDTPAGFYNLAGTEYTFYLNPHVAKSHVDAFSLELARQYFGKIVERPFHEAPYMMGTDSFLGEPMIGIPTVWPYSGSGVHTHHNSADTPDDVDPRSLRDLTVVTAAYLYYLASAGKAEAGWLAELSLARGYRQILSAADNYVQEARLTTNKGSLRRLLRDGIEKVNYTTDREVRAVESVRRLAPDFDTKPLIRQLEELCDRQIFRLRQATGGLEPEPPDSDPKLAGAEDIIVQRKKIGTITLDDLPVDQREGWPSAAWNTRVATAIFWCDGKRNLAEVVRLTRLELGPDDFDYVGYFRFLARKGYVDLK